MPYRYYPTERLAEAGLTAVDATHTGTTNTYTHFHTTGGGYRLDYLLVSDDILHNAYGGPQAEVYNSASDGPGLGLTKYGDPLPANTSSNASDHRMVFADIHLIDEVAGWSPVAILSEIVDHPVSTNYNYVEICNTGGRALDLNGYSLAVHINRDLDPTATIALSGALAAGHVRTLATSTNHFYQHYGIQAQQQAAIIGRLDGNDTVVLRKDGVGSDIYGKVRQISNLNDYSVPWAYRHSAAVRNVGVSDPIPEWRADEWTITLGTNSVTPGSHVALLVADAFVANMGLEPLTPHATDAFSIRADIQPNAMASNMTAIAWLRIANGAFYSTPMTSVGGSDWSTALLNPGGRNPGDALEYYIRYSFDGPLDRPPSRPQPTPIGSPRARNRYRRRRHSRRHGQLPGPLESHPD
jgi:hypothetical protein